MSEQWIINFTIFGLGQLFFIGFYQANKHGFIRMMFFSFFIGGSTVANPLMLIANPPVGFLLLAWTIFCWKIHDSKSDVKKKKPKKTQSKAKHDVNLRKYLNFLSEPQLESWEKDRTKLKQSETKINQKSQQLNELLKENQRLKEIQQQELRKSEGTKRLQFYRKEAQKRIDQEDQELSKLKAKRLEEQIRNLKNTDN